MSLNLAGHDGRASSPAGLVTFWNLATIKTAEYVWVERMFKDADLAGFNFSRLTLQETVDQVEQWATDESVRGRCLAIVNLLESKKRLDIKFESIILAV